MKKIITLAFAILTTGVITAQCTEVATGFGNNTNIPIYNIEGDVSITLNTDNSLTLDLGDNFMTAAGPDIRAFLVNSNGIPDNQLVSTQIGNLENIQFGLVGNLSGVNQNGAKSFTIDVPEDLELENFDKIFFYCLQFDQFWDFGTITPFDPSDCNILNVDTIVTNAFTMTPNPAKDVISINGIETNDAEIRIFDALGNVVFTDTATRNNNYDLSNFTSGIYLVTVISGETQTTQKLVIE